jgi:hypothetical protein
MNRAITAGRPIFVCTAVICTLAAALAPGAGLAQPVPPDAMDRFKAAYVFNFAKFVAWPASAPADVLTICFRGATAVHDLLAHDVSGALIGARRVIVRSIQTAQRADGCSIVYVGAELAPDTNLASSVPPFALTVSDALDFTDHGGMIGLFTEGNRLRFNINLENARLAGLKVSSDLLQLASRVEREHSR